MTKTVGLTGGIGSGKTTVASVFKTLGVPVYHADDEAKLLMQHSKSIREGLISLFGDKAFENQILNKSYISQQIFSDQSLLKQMNALVHPEVAQHYATWLSKQSSPYVVKEVAILFEIGAQDQFDFIITVTAPKSVRLERTKKRDNKSEREIEAIMDNQLSDSKKVKQSDFVIQNLNWNRTAQKVLNIHNEIIKLIN